MNKLEKDIMKARALASLATARSIKLEIEEAMRSDGSINGVLRVCNNWIASCESRIVRIREEENR